MFWVTNPLYFTPASILYNGHCRLSNQNRTRSSLQANNSNTTWNISQNPSDISLRRRWVEWFSKIKEDNVGFNEVVIWKRAANKWDRLCYHWQRQFGSKKYGSLSGDYGKPETYKRKGSYILLTQIYHVQAPIVLFYKESLSWLLIKWRHFYFK